MLDQIFAMSFGHVLYLALQLSAGITLWFCAMGMWGAYFLESLFASSDRPWSIFFRDWIFLILAIIWLRGFPFPALW